jgi:molybdopterin synthase catalytic subunit
MSVSIQHEDFDGALSWRLRATSNVGAMVNRGPVRDLSITKGGNILSSIIRRGRRPWIKLLPKQNSAGTVAVKVIHRVGTLGRMTNRAGGNLHHTAGMHFRLRIYHRLLKTDAPFWKSQTTGQMSRHQRQRCAAHGALGPLIAA